MMPTQHYYAYAIDDFRKQKKLRFDKMNKEGYQYATVTQFNNEKGVGFAEDSLGNKFIVHYKNMNRINYKILSAGQTIHLKPGIYNYQLTAEDIAILY